MATCASCGTNNVEGTKFCVNCGAALAPSPGSWRAGTDELNNQPGGGGDGGASSSNPQGGVGNPYAPPPSYSPQAPPSYAATQPYYGQAPGVPAMPFGAMRYAEWGQRVPGALIDGLISGGAAIVLIVIAMTLGLLGSAAGGGGDTGSSIMGGLMCIGVVLAGVASLGVGLYNKVFLVAKRGASIGQGIMGLKMVDAAGNLPQMGSLIIRLLVSVGLGMIPMVGTLGVIIDYLWPLWDEKKQTLHDKVAGTFVIKSA